MFVHGFHYQEAQMWQSARLFMSKLRIIEDGISRKVDGLEVVICWIWCVLKWSISTILMGLKSTIKADDEPKGQLRAGVYRNQVFVRRY